MTPLSATWIFSKELLYLTALKEFKSLAQASEVLNVGPITLSKNIKKLEEAIGCPLVVVPTEAWKPYVLTETGDYLVNVLSPMIEDTMSAVSNMTHVASLKYKYDRLPEPSKHHVMERTLMNDVFKKALADMYKPKVRKWMSEAPVDCFNVYSNFQIYLEGYDYIRHSKYLNKGSYRYYFTTEAVPLLKNKHTVINLNKKSKYYKPLRNAIKELDKIEKEESATRATIYSALNTCSTVKKLQDSYPDLIKYLPMEVTSPSKALSVTNAQIKKVLKDAKPKGDKSE